MSSSSREPEPSSEPSVDDDAVRLGDRLRGRFHVMAELGRGGMGVVYEAFDLERGGPVALKVLSSRGSDASSIARLKREFRTLADLRHPNLVRLGELFGDARPWFFTMERVDGVDLLRWVRAESGTDARSALASSGGPTLVDPPASELLDAARSAPSPTVDAPPRARASSDERRLRAVLAQLVDALGALHAAGHVHRDLKPSNVLVTPEGKAVLIDFGIARPRIAHHGAHEPLEGTPAYMAPEQWLARSAGPAADWYALGVILFEALAGRLPVDGSVRDMLLAKRAGFTHVPTTGWLAPDLERLTLRLLAPEPTDRPDADEIRAVLAAGTRPVSLALAEQLRPSAPHFVGRSSELAQLWQAFELSRSGGATVTRVVGESGVGKTALVDQFVDAVADAERDTVVLRGRCYENELVPYKAWDSLVDALARHLVLLDERKPGALVAILPPDLYGLTRLFPALEAVAALVPDRDTGDSRLPLGPERLRQRSFEDLRELLRGLARLGPLVLTIDDWQWADHDSAQLLDALLHEPGSPRLLLVITERPRRDAEQGAGIGSTIVLGPLGPSETERLAQALSAEPQTVSTIATLARESGGHPMFLQQLVHWSRGARESQRLDDLIVARARSLEADARRVLELLCIAGAPLPRTVVEAAAALPRARCAQVIDDLVAEKLVRAAGTASDLEPWHDRIRESIESALPDEARVGLHASLASSLSSHGSDSHASQLVRHLEAAGLRARAAEAAEAGARRARDALAFEHAAELFRRALELGTHTHEQRIALSVELADALASAGLGAREAANGFLAGADAETELDRALELRTRALDQLAIAGHVAEALALVHQIYATLGAPLPASRVGLVLGMWLHRARLRLYRWPDAAALDALSVAPESVASRLYTTTINSITILDPLIVQYIHARTLVGALAARDRTTLALCASRESGLAVVFGPSRLEHAERASQLAHRLFGDTAVGPQRGWLHVGDAIRHHFTGRFGRALEHWREARRVFLEEPRPPFALLSGILIFELACHRYLGGLAELRAELERARRDARARGDRYLEVTATLSSGIATLLVDGADAALAELERVDTTTELASWGPNVWYQARSRAEADLHRGAPIDTLAQHALVMRRLARTPSGFVATWRAEMPWVEARLWLACADQGDRSGLRRVGRIARKLSAGVLPYEQIWGGLLSAALRASAGDVVGTCASLDRTAELAKLHGYVLCEAAARLRLAELSPAHEAAARARATLEGEGVTDIASALRVMAPGFGPRRTLPAQRAALAPDAGT